jgi:hypothetical protein
LYVPWLASSNDININRTPSEPVSFFGTNKITFLLSKHGGDPSLVGSGGSSDGNMVDMNSGPPQRPRVGVYQQYISKRLVQNITVASIISLDN